MWFNGSFINIFTNIIPTIELPDFSCNIRSPTEVWKTWNLNSFNSINPDYSCIQNVTD